MNPLLIAFLIYWFINAVTCTLTAIIFLIYLLARAVAKRLASLRKCTNCNYKPKWDARYCSRCGVNLANAAAEKRTWNDIWQRVERYENRFGIDAAYNLAAELEDDYWIGQGLLSSNPQLTRACQQRSRHIRKIRRHALTHRRRPGRK
jgi:hypothetical protein